VFRVQCWKNFWQDESAQGITEYGAVLALVAVLIAVFLGLTNGTLLPAVSNAFSSISSQLNYMAQEATSAS